VQGGVLEAKVVSALSQTFCVVQVRAVPAEALVCPGEQRLVLRRHVGGAQQEGIPRDRTVWILFSRRHDALGRQVAKDGGPAAAGTRAIARAEALVYGTRKKEDAPVERGSGSREHFPASHCLGPRREDVHRRDYVGAPLEAERRRRHILVGLHHRPIVSKGRRRGGGLCSGSVLPRLLERRLSWWFCRRGRDGSLANRERRTRALVVLVAAAAAAHDAYACCGLVFFYAHRYTLSSAKREVE